MGKVVLKMTIIWQIDIKRRVLSDNGLNCWYNNNNNNNYYIYYIFFPTPI